MMKKTWVLLLSALLIGACNNAPDNSGANSDTDDMGQSGLKKEVMIVHDTAMAKMSTISHLQKRLKKEWQTFSGDSLEYQRSYQQLGRAKDDMMKWMRNFEIPEGVAKDEVRQYLRKEKKAIKAVDSGMDNAIAEARFLLNSSKAKQTDADSLSLEAQEK